MIQCRGCGFAAWCRGWNVDRPPHPLRSMPETISIPRRRPGRRSGASSRASWWRCSSPRPTRPFSRARCRRSPARWAASPILSWVVVAYLLAATVAAPLYGHLGDHFGRQRMLLGALAVFTAGVGRPVPWRRRCLLLIVARALQGLGRRRSDDAGAGADRRARGAARARALRGLFRHGLRAGQHVRTGAGRLSDRAFHAGARCSRSTCRSALLAAMLALRIPRPPRDRAHRAAFARTSSARCCSALDGRCCSFALTSGGHRFAWTSGDALRCSPAAVAGVSSLLLAWERRVADPVIPIRFLRNPGDRALRRGGRCASRGAVFDDPLPAAVPAARDAGCASARRACCCCRSRCRWSCRRRSRAGSSRRRAT